MAAKVVIFSRIPDFGVDLGSDSDLKIHKILFPFSILGWSVPTQSTGESVIIRGGNPLTNYDCNSEIKQRLAMFS